MVVVPKFDDNLSERERLMREYKIKQRTDPNFMREQIRAKDTGIFATLFRKRPYPHNPLCGENPMRYPYTLTAKFVQFPLIYWYRYFWMWKSFLISSLILMPIISKKIENLSYTPSNVEKWKIIRHHWYVPVKDPDDHLY